MSATEAYIRQAGPEDIEVIVELNAALFREDAGQRDPFTNVDWPDEWGLDHFAGLATRDFSLCLVAESAGKVVGYLAGYKKPKNSLRPVEVAELESMYVRNTHRSRRVGERLVEEFLEWARAQEAERASVTAYAANEHAVRFYERSGFQTHSLSLELSIPRGDVRTT